MQSRGCFFYIITCFLAEKPVCMIWEVGNRKNVTCWNRTIFPYHRIMRRNIRRECRWIKGIQHDTEVIRKWYGNDTEKPRSVSKHRISPLDDTFADGNQPVSGTDSFRIASNSLIICIDTMIRKFRAKIIYEKKSARTFAVYWFGGTPDNSYICDIEITDYERYNDFNCSTALPVRLACK